MDFVDVVIICLGAVLIVIVGTGYAWWEYRARPHHYLRQTNQPRTDTRRPVRNWTASWIRGSGYHAPPLDLDELPPPQDPAPTSAGRRRRG